MTTIAGSPPLSVYGYDTPAPGAAASVAATSDPGLPQAAATLAADAGVVASLGGTSVGGLTYNAAGLLDAIAQAGAASSPPPAGAADPQQSLDQAVAATLPPSPATSGIYTSSGLLQALPAASVTSNWANLLQANPALAGVAIGDSFDQGIVGTISTTA